MDINFLLYSLLYYYNTFEKAILTCDHALISLTEVFRNNILPFLVELPKSARCKTNEILHSTFYAIINAL